MSSFVPYTVPPAGSHPRVWVNPNTGLPNYAPKISTLQTRIATTHSDQWSKLRAFVSAHLANPSTYNLAYYKSQNFEYLAASAFIYLLDNTATAEAAHARDIALQMAFEAVGSKTLQRREIMCAMAFVYDWLYNWSGLTDANKVSLRTALGNSSGWIDTYRGVSDNNFTWGTNHGDMVKAMLAHTAILNDSNLNGGATNPSNATWNGWMDTMMDQHDNGGSSGSFLALFRHFARDESDVDIGGTYKGSGNYSYWCRNQEFYCPLLPALKSAMNVSWQTTENWWNTSMWDLWHWRGDRTFHRQNDHLGQDNYQPFQHAHVYMTAAYQKGVNLAFAENTTWLADEMARNDVSVKQAIWGPYMMYRILHEDTTIAGVRPTIASMGGKQMKWFPRAGKVILRDGWEETSTSVTIEASRYFLGGHQRRGSGHWDLCTKGNAVIIENGHYDGSETTTYKTLPTSTPPTGHRYTYMKNALSLNALRIHNSSEPTSNPTESFQRDQGSGSSALASRFGTRLGTAAVSISNFGGLTWPKNTAMNVSQPADLADLLAEPKWQFATFSIPPVDDTKFEYVVANLQPQYWSGKCSRFKRHWLWIKAGTITGWNEPLILMVDDVIAVNDGTFANRSVVLQLQSNAQPSGNGNDLTFTKGSNAKMYYRAFKPTGLQLQQVSGFSDNSGVVYPPSKTSGHDDSIYPAGSNPWRSEIYPASYSGSIQFVYLIAPCDRALQGPPPAVLIDDATWLGLTFTDAQVEAKIKKGDTHQALVQSTASSTPPITGGPSTNDNRRSAPTSIWGTTIPVPDGVINRANRVHICFLYSGTNIQTPPVDISVGEPIECDEVSGAGAAISTVPSNTPALAGGASIGVNTGTPSAGEGI